MVAMDGTADDGLTHMGGEGAELIGESKFFNARAMWFPRTSGNGTYNHSGNLAIRGGPSRTRTNITYKILYNDAVR